MPALSEQKQASLEKWLALTLATYPSQTSRFLQSDKDRFRNPMGHMLREGLAILLDEITGDMDSDRLGVALDSIVRLRAVQDFTPSEAVGFVYLLRDVLQEDRAAGTPPDLERRIDRTALQAFDLFMKCREEIYQIKAREARRQLYVLERMRERVQGEEI